MMNGEWKAFAGALVLAGALAVGVADSAPAFVPGPETIRAVADPDTTGAAMWAHLQEENYQDTWELWPGMGELYEGNQPHGMLLTTYVNDVAFEAISAGRTTMPAGAVIIKENYTPDRDLAAVTVMYKRPGYNPDHNDWFFTKHLPDGSLDTMPNGMDMEGRLPGCQGCHIARAQTDYLYTPFPNN